jgi:hypothetical protein
VSAPALAADATFEFDWARQARFCYDPRWSAERAGGCLGHCDDAAACARACAGRDDCAGFVVWEGQPGLTLREGAGLMTSLVLRASCDAPTSSSPGQTNLTTYLRRAGFRLSRCAAAPLH